MRTLPTCSAEGCLHTRFKSTPRDQVRSLRLCSTMVTHSMRITWMLNPSHLMLHLTVHMAGSNTGAAHQRLQPGTRRAVCAGTTTCTPQRIPDPTFSGAQRFWGQRRCTTARAPQAGHVVYFTRKPTIWFIYSHEHFKLATVVVFVKGGRGGPWDAEIAAAVRSYLWPVLLCAALPGCQPFHAIFQLRPESSTQPQRQGILVEAVQVMNTN
eukprot:1160034-Pelagomonas_calceolata.AAC.6